MYLSIIIVLATASVCSVPIHYTRNFLWKHNLRSTCIVVVVLLFFSNPLKAAYIFIISVTVSNPSTLSLFISLCINLQKTPHLLWKWKWSLSVGSSHLSSFSLNQETIPIWTVPSTWSLFPMWEEVCSFSANPWVWVLSSVSLVSQVVCSAFCLLPSSWDSFSPSPWVIDCLTFNTSLFLVPPISPNGSPVKSVACRDTRTVCEMFSSPALWSQPILPSADTAP